MRTFYLLPLCLLLSFCAGCPQTPAVKKPEAPQTQPEKPVTETKAVTDKNEPYVEPLVPKTEPPEVPKKEGEPAPEKTGPTLPNSTPPNSTLPNSTPPNNTPAAGVPSVPLGKFAAEAVPLPPVADLTGQLDEYVAKLASLLENLDGSTKYKEDSGDMVRDAHALMLVALAIGLSDGDSKYKKSAANIIAAAKTLAAADNLEAGQKAYKDLTASLEKKDGGQPLNWTAKTAGLVPLMKAVPNLSSFIKRLNTEKKLKAMLDKKPAAVFGALAALAVIPQGSIANAAETSKPDAAAEWQKDCEHFRDAALKANGAAHQFADGKAGFADFQSAVSAMQKSCDQCHEKFHPAAVETNDKKDKKDDN